MDANLRLLNSELAVVAHVLHQSAASHTFERRLKQLKTGQAPALQTKQRGAGMSGQTASSGPQQMSPAQLKAARAARECCQALERAMGACGCH